MEYVQTYFEVDENEAKLNGFIKNVKECTALEDYFIGTCYDGQKIFNMLNSLKINWNRSFQ